MKTDLRNIFSKLDFNFNLLKNHLINAEENQKALIQRFDHFNSQIESFLKLITQQNEHHDKLSKYTRVLAIITLIVAIPTIFIGIATIMITRNDVKNNEMEASQNISIQRIKTTVEVYKDYQSKFEKDEPDLALFKNWLQNNVKLKDTDAIYRDPKFVDFFNFMEVLNNLRKKQLLDSETTIQFFVSPISIAHNSRKVVSSKMIINKYKSKNLIPELRNTKILTGLDELYDWVYPQGIH